MNHPGYIVFAVAPLVLTAVLLRLDPRGRRTRPSSVLLYWVVMSALIWGALQLLGASTQEAVRNMGRRPLMVIHGSDDFMMSASHAQRIHDAANGPRDIWFGPGPHSNIITTDPSGYAARLFAFLDHHLGRAPMPPPVRRHTRPASAPETVRTL